MKKKKSHAIVIKYKDEDKRCREEIALVSDIGSDSDVHSSQAKLFDSYQVSKPDRLACEKLCLGHS